MTKAIFSKVTVALLILGLGAGAASAKDMGGKFGIGLNQSLTGGSTGLAANYWIGNFKLGAILGFDIFSPNADGADPATNLDFGVQGLFAIARANNVNLNTGLRFTLGFVDTGVANADTQTSFGFEIPLEAEYFFDDHFSILGHVGLVINIIPEEGDAFGSGLTDGIQFGFGTGGFSGGVGFNFYF